MIERFETFINCKQHLRDNYSKIIEAFVDYYGEDARTEIEEKFSKALPVAYISPEEKKKTFMRLKKNISSEIYDIVLKKIPSIWTKEDLFSNYDIESHEFFPISLFQKFLEQYELGENGRVKLFKERGLKHIRSFLHDFTEEEYEALIQTHQLPEKYAGIPPFIKKDILYYADLSNSGYDIYFKNAKEILQKIDPNVTIENVDQVLELEEVKMLKKYIEVLPISISYYETKMNKYTSLKESLKKHEEIKNRLMAEYMRKYIEENIDLLNEKERQKFKETCEKNIAYRHPIFGYSFLRESIYESFSDEAEKTLQSDVSNWRKESIIKDRIEYFKLCGFDLGDNYENYVSNVEVKKIWPSSERVRKFIESKRLIINEFNNEYYTSLPEHAETRREIEECHLLDVNDDFDANLYIDNLGATFVSPNLISTPNGYDLFSLVVIACGNFDYSIDHNIIHEFNHLLELNLSEVNGDYYRATCGWDIIEDKFGGQDIKTVDTLNIDTSKRDYELFNEIINELIAQEIYSKMLDKNGYIFDTPETAKVKGNTSYERSVFLVEDFFHEFKEEILASRRNGNINIIWDKVGKDNFDELNSLFAIFQEHFQGFKMVSLYDAILKKQDTEQTRIYRDLIARRDEIMERMREHSLHAGKNNKK